MPYPRIRFDSILPVLAGLLPLATPQPTSTLLAADLSDLVAPGASVRKVAGEFQFTEGPTSSPEGVLLFSDIPASHIMELLPDGSTRVFLEGSERANGLQFDAAGRLFVCQGGGRRVVRIDGPRKAITVLADAYEGKKLNSPNDLALDARGGLYFTDPSYDRRAQLEQPVMGVYYISSDGKVSRVIDSLERPNGILVSPDGKALLVANPDRREVHRFPIEGPGQLGPGKVIFTGDEALDGGGPDGMAHDARGNVYATYKGIVVLAPNGELLGRIPVPEQPANCTFGGKDRKTLYITARRSLYAIDMRVEGMALQGTTATAKKKVVMGALKLDVPAAWKEERPSSRMRVGQLSLPPVEGDQEPVELVVFYFGPNGAGTDEANFDRWVGQFAAEGRESKRSEGKSAQGVYTQVEITGTYLKQEGGPGAPGPAKPLPGSRMLGVILHLEGGKHYLRLVGPDKTVSAARAAFLQSFGAGTN